MSMESLFDRGGIERTPNGTVDGKPVYRYETKCSRCGGAGGAEQWRHTGYKCFQCGGDGKGPVKAAKLYTAEKLAKLNASQAKRDEKRRLAAQAKADAIAAERDARRAMFLADNAGFIAKLRTLDGDYWDGFASGFLERCQDASPRQIEVVEAEIARRAAKAASCHVGAVNERVTLIVTTEKVVDITVREASGYARFGSRFMFLARDSHGNRIVYKGNGDFPGEGQTATIKATVAEHAEYNGERQTMVQRPKCIEAQAVA
jgi:hypothetical protein